MILDPYPLAYARTVFALQTLVEVPPAQIETEMLAWMEQWRAALAQLGEEAPPGFFDRFLSGITDAIAQGPVPREYVDVGRTQTDAYRLFPSGG